MPSTSRGTLHRLFSGVAVLEDFADRLSHVWTFPLLLIFASVISWRQQSFNAPIVCFLPAEFTPAMANYAHQACWNSEKLKYTRVYADFSVFKLVGEVEGRIYKWLPVVLCIQAFVFKVPNLLMHILHGYSGVSFEKIAGLTYGYQRLNLMERKYLGKQTGRYLYNWCKQCENCFPWRCLSGIWLLVKILFCTNAITQLVLVDKLVSPRHPPLDNTTSYGDVIYSNLFNKNSTEWIPSPIFPRTVMCNYSVRQITRVVDFEIQCDLPVNEFIEYMYMILWVWLLIVTIISCLSIIVWLIFAIVPIARERYISRILDMSEELNSAHLNRNDVSRLTGMLGEDGVMVLKLIASNSSELIVRDAVTTMYQMKMPPVYQPQQPQTASEAAITTPLLVNPPGEAQSSL